MRILQLLIAFFILSSCNTKKKPLPFYYLKSDSLNTKAYEFIETKNFDSAEYYISRSLYFDSSNYGAYNNRAILKFRKNEPKEEVVADFETALKLNPSYEISLISLVNYYDIINDYKNVIKSSKRYFENSKKENPQNVKQIDNLFIKARRMLYSKETPNNKIRLK